MHYVPILHNILLAFDAQLAVFAYLDLATCLEIILIANHLRTDKALLEVGMNFPRALRGRRAVFDRPGTRFLRADGKKRD